MGFVLYPDMRLSHRMCMVILSLGICCVATLSVRVLCRALHSNAVAYSITSSLYCCHHECSGFVFGPV